MATTLAHLAESQLPYVASLSELLNDAKTHYDLAKPHKQDALLRTVFSELTLSENALEYKCRNGFKALESRLVDFSEPTDRLSEPVTTEISETPSVKMSQPLPPETINALVELAEVVRSIRRRIGLEISSTYSEHPQRPR